MLSGIFENCAVLDVCPSLLRKAFMGGLTVVLKEVIGEKCMNENVTHLWNKVYRVLEQVVHILSSNQTVRNFR